MKKVIMMRGLPGSGKSTRSKQILDENPGVYKRINRDELRAMFDNAQIDAANEKFIRQVRDMLIIKTLEDGKNVIVDDTHLSEKNETYVKELVHEFNKQHNDNVTVELIEMDTPLDECIERDSKREKSVGAKVIKQMHQQFYKAKLKYAEQDASLPKAIMCDLDGTLALLHKRGPFEELLCESDELNQPVANVVLNYHKSGYKILLLSGRRDIARQQTENWLKKHNIPYDLLLMRSAKDASKDSIVKRQLFEENIQHKFYIEFVLDDRNQVVDMWRNELNLPCFQVFYGDF